MEALTPQESPERKGNHCESTNDNRIWRMRWCFIWIGTTFCILWFIAAVVLTVVIFSETRSYFSFVFSGSTAIWVYFLRTLAEYLFPMDEKRFQLKKLKIEQKIQKKMQDRQVGTSKTITKAFPNSQKTGKLTLDEISSHGEEVSL